jgi:16S rRNA (uracil1498-N3)-methyltransferase
VRAGRRAGGADGVGVATGRRVGGAEATGVRAGRRAGAADAAPAGAGRHSTDADAAAVGAGLVPARAPDRILLAVGPEGGWNDFERGLLESRGFRRISLGPRTLRTDTACIALHTLVMTTIVRPSSLGASVAASPSASDPPAP